MVNNFDFFHRGQRAPLRACTQEKTYADTRVITRVGTLRVALPSSTLAMRAPAGSGQQ